MSTTHVTFTGITPYLHYEDISAAIAWLTRVFGFIEKARWIDDAGNITNAELVVGNTELWLDGASDWWKKKGQSPEEWIGVWVDDVEAMYQRVQASGVQASQPEYKFYGVRVLQVRDPQGFIWGFMQRAPVQARAPAGPKL